jgi:hypothetical protein
MSDAKADAEPPWRALQCVEPALRLITGAAETAGPSPAGGKPLGWHTRLGGLDQGIEAFQAQADDFGGEAKLADGLGLVFGQHCEGERFGGAGVAGQGGKDKADQHRDDQIHG